MTANKFQKGKIMTLIEVIRKDGQRHLSVKSAITSGTTQYFDKWSKNLHSYNINNVAANIIISIFLFSSRERKNGDIFYRLCTGVSTDGSRHTCWNRKLFLSNFLAARGTTFQLYTLRTVGSGLKSRTTLLWFIHPKLIPQATRPIIFLSLA